MKDKGEIPTVTVHVWQIKKTKTLPLTQEEEWRKDISEDQDLRYNKSMLSSP